MLSVRELRSMVSSFSREQFQRQLGPFVLVQRPVEDAGELPTEARTMVVRPEQVSAGALSLLFQFDDLEVASLPPLHGVDELSVGRQPDCDLVIDDPSVSKRHAVLRWDAATNRCTVQDAGSTNGTFLNASIRLKKETVLKDGDILSFGEVQYWYLLTGTLHEKLTRGSRRDFGV